MSERSSAVGYQENDKDIRTVCGFVEDIRDAVVEYQVSPDLSVTFRMPGRGSLQLHQQRALYDQNCKLIVSNLQLRLTGQRTLIGFRSTRVGMGFSSL